MKVWILARDAWAALGDLGKDDAMQRYVELLCTVAPDWDAAASGSKPGKSRGGGGAMGPVFSSLAAGEEAEAGGEGDEGVSAATRPRCAGLPVSSGPLCCELHASYLHVIGHMPTPA